MYMDNEFPATKLALPSLAPPSNDHTVSIVDANFSFDITARAVGSNVMGQNVDAHSSGVSVPMIDLSIPCDRRGILGLPAPLIEAGALLLLAVACLPIS